MFRTHALVPVILLVALLFAGCSGPASSSKDNVSDPVVYPYGTSFDADGKVILPYGTEILPDGTFVLTEAEVQPGSAFVSVGDEAPSDVDTPAAGIPDVTPLPDSTAPEERFLYDRDERDYFDAGLEAKTDLPTVCIFTNNSEPILSRTDYTRCIVDVINCDEAFALRSAPAGIRLRGNSTAFYGKYKDITTRQVPYRIKFDTKTSMLGLNNAAKCRSWVLLKFEWDLVREDLMFHLGRALMHGNMFCSDSTMVNVYVNGKFKGLYTLCEQNQVNKHRVNITECPEGSTDLDIGYYLELDNYGEEPRFDCTYAGNSVVTDIYGVSRPVETSWYSIKSDVYDNRQVDFIGTYLNEVYNILYYACVENRYFTLSEEFTPGSTGSCTGAFDEPLVPAPYTCAEDTVSAVLDLDSVVDMYILHELSMSCDCGEGSFYMCVDFAKDSRVNRLTFTTPWDFNWSASPDPVFWAGSFRDDAFVAQSGDRSNPWFIVLLTQDWFRSRVRERLGSLIADGTLDSVLESERGFIDTYRTDLEAIVGWNNNTALELLDRFAERIKWLYNEL